MAFLYGLTGLTLATLGMRYFMVVDWPMNIGGKPNFTYLDNILAFVPISFEFTVLCAAHGMAITYLLLNKTLPGMPNRLSILKLQYLAESLTTKATMNFTVLVSTVS
jgi:hypothetical protein